eukprot:3475244-Karenia_brevis.AAC.1
MLHPLVMLWMLVRSPRSHYMTQYPGKLAMWGMCKVSRQVLTTSPWLLRSLQTGWLVLAKTKRQGLTLQYRHHGLFMIIH